MATTKLKIKDGSGDKEFFTIIPNFIINHSTAIDRALYLEMKRFAGEDGKCFATMETMMKRLNIGRKAFHKSMDYLMSRGWITFVGLTGGKTRPVKTYKVNNIWQENSDYYKKIPAERAVSFKGGTPGDTGQKSSKIPAERAVEEDPSEKKNIISKDIIAEPPTSFGNPLINDLTQYFEKRIGGSLDGKKLENRRFAHLLIGRMARDYPDKNTGDLVKRLISLATMDEFHGKNATGFKYLYYNAQKIISSTRKVIEKEERDSPKGIDISELAKQKKHGKDILQR